MVIGITGGVGCGKSTVLNILRRDYGFFILQTDELAKEIMAGDAEVRAQLKVAFGTEIFMPDGQIDKARYATLIYQDREARLRSDAIVHPAVWKRSGEVLRAAMEKAEQEQLPFNAALETALPEQAFSDFCDEVWYICAKEEVRIQRLMASRAYSREKCAEMIRNQPNEAAYQKLADRLIDNSGEEAETRAGLDKAIRELGLLI